MSVEGRSKLISSVVVTIFTLAFWTLSSCDAWRSTTFKLNLELKDKTIQDDAAEIFYDVKRPMRCAMQCTEKSECAFFSHNAADGVCVLHRSPFLSFNFTHAPGYDVFTMAEIPLIVPDIKTAQECPADTGTPLGCWKQVSGGLDQVSVGPAGVWGINAYNYIWHLTGTYGDLRDDYSGLWLRVIGALSQVDVGSDIVLGVNSANALFYRSGITPSLPQGLIWQKVADNFTWVSVSPAGSVWAVDGAGQLLHARDSASELNGNSQWDVMAANMRRVDAGRAGVWALDDAGHLFYRRGTYGDNNGGDGNSTGTGWVMVGGTFSCVSSGTNLVVAVTSAGRIWVRVGLSPDVPTGLGWALYPGVMKHVEVYEAESMAVLWGLKIAREIYYSVIEK